MTDEIVTAISNIDAPYGRKIVLESVEYASGMSMLRIRIREGGRFTVLDIDEETARRWSAAMTSWVGKPLH